MKRVFIKRAIKISSLIIAIAVCVFVFSSVFLINNDANSQRNADFYREEKNSLDVVFIGSSEVMSGFYPGLAYKNYGITSFDWVNDSASISMWKSKLEELKKYQTPKLIVVEISGAFYDDDYDIYKDLGIRSYVENMPLSFNKIKTISSAPLEDDALSYYFPFIKYHEFSLDSQKIKDSMNIFFNRLNSESLLKGILTETVFSGEELINISDSSKSLPINKTAENYLRDFLDYCKDSGIQNILFTAFPHKHADDRAIEYLYKSNTVEEIVKAYGYEFINFDRNQEQLGLDYSKDFYNDFHLSIYGAQKVTNAYCRLFKDKFDVSEIQRSEYVLKSWEACSEYTEKYIEYADNRYRQGIDEWIYERTDFKQMVDSYKP